MMAVYTRIIAFLLVLIGFSFPAFAQEAQERSALISFVEDKLSAPNRQIRLNGIQGTLSSNVSLDSITIADEDGIWLTIIEPQLVWSRTALLTGRLEIERLAATRIDMPRGPKPDESLPDAEAAGFALPELPVSINLQELDVPQIAFGQTVFGLQSEMSVNGSIRLADGSLTTDLDLVRLDGPGGALALDVVFDGAKEALDLSAILNEPENGIIANLLNLENRPPVSLIIEGDAPLSDLAVDLQFQVDEKEILAGALTLTDSDNGRLVGLNLGGPLSSIMPQDYQKLLGNESRISANLVLEDAGQIDINTVSLDSGAIKLSANARVLADGFLSALNLKAQIIDVAGGRIFLPNDETTSFQDAQIEIVYDADQGNSVRQILALSDLRTDMISIGNIDLNTMGVLDNFDQPENRSFSFATKGAINGVVATDKALSDALGGKIDIMGDGIWKTGRPLQLSAFDIVGKDYSVRTNGQISGAKFDGQIGLEAAQLSSFSALSGQTLSGSVGLVANGTIEPISGAFNLDLSGVGNALKTGIAAADTMLKGATNLSGTVRRDETGLGFERLRITNNQADILLDGSYASALKDIKAQIDLRDLADVSDQGTGAVQMTAALKGETQPYDTQIMVSMPRGQLAGKAVQDLTLGFNGTAGAEKIEGSLNGDGFLDGQAIDVKGQIIRDDEALVLNAFLAKIGAADLSLDLTRNNESGLMAGKLEIDARNIDALAALALQEARGALNAAIDLSIVDGGQSADVNASANGLAVGQNQIGAANIDAQITTLLSDPKINADINARDITAGGVQIRDVSGTVKTAGDVIDFDVAANLAQENARIATRGTFTQLASSQRVNIDQLSLQSNLGDAQLSAPTSLQIADGVVTISDTNLIVAGGAVRLNGRAGDTLAINANISQLPLSIANAFNASLGLGGIINADINVTGSAASPNAAFNVSGSGITATQLQQSQIAPLTIDASGAYDGAGIINLASLSVANTQNIQLIGSGTIPLSSGGLNFAADGSAPLSIADQFLADRGARVSGLARFNITATGALSNPQLGGLLSVAGGSLIDPLSNLQLNDIGLIAGLSGETINIQRLSAQLSSGGAISGSGTVGISGAMPANLNLALQNARYTDGQTFVVTAAGQLAVTGSLAADPLLSGRIDLIETQITVPENFAGNATLLDVQHISPDSGTQRTLDRLAAVTPLPKPSSRPSILQLDLTINAPNRIFVRGRGLDAELGGQLALRGPVTNVQPTGRFNLLRGRLGVIGQRFDLDEGSVTLTGDLNPLLRFVARTQSGDVTAFITLAGRADDLDVSFTSSPELPQDEVLAVIIFGKNLAQLSPSQISRLVAIAAELTGGNSPGLVDGLRSGLGLDDLDVVQDSDGNAAVKAGKYISDNVYLGVQAGQETEATINLDITDSLTARGSVSSKGDTSLGVFFERDY